MRLTAFFMALSLLLACGTALGAEVAPAEIFEAPVQITVTFTGDCTLGNTPLERQLESGFESFIEKNGKEYPFANVKHIFEHAMKTK